MDTEPADFEEALAGVLTLAIVATSDAKSAEAMEVVDALIPHLDAAAIDRANVVAKRRAAEWQQLK
ncbi:MAG: hypothetical protein P8R36_05180 [Actinomycetota bacterium]|nr:hypothetical protein [Actinomycetota bacterium]MDG1489661.1 hypothetical protein [Actinomycetota bacterium]MDG2121888.1 hypothetical protein [Actinomycetota bacterium]